MTRLGLPSCTLLRIDRWLDVRSCYDLLSLLAPRRATTLARHCCFSSILRNEAQSKEDDFNSMR